MADIGGAISGGASIIGGIIGGNSAEEAAETQSDAAAQAAQTNLTATRETIAAQERATAQSRADLEPWRTAGAGGLELQQGLLGINPHKDDKPLTYEAWLASKGNATPNNPALRTRSRNSYNAYVNREKAAIRRRTAGWSGTTPTSLMKLDPGYKFRRDEGLRAVDQASAVSRGPGISGATLKELERYGSDYASNEFQNIFSRASSLSGSGLGAATGQANFTQAGATNNANTTMAGANNMANYTLQGANAQSAGTIASGNAWSSSINNVADQFYLRNLLQPQRTPAPIEERI